MRLVIAWNSSLLKNSDSLKLQISIHSSLNFVDDPDILIIGLILNKVCLVPISFFPFLTLWQDFIWPLFNRWVIWITFPLKMLVACWKFLWLFISHFLHSQGISIFLQLHFELWSYHSLEIRHDTVSFASKLNYSKTMICLLGVYGAICLLAPLQSDCGFVGFLIATGSWLASWCYDDLPSLG